MSWQQGKLGDFVEFKYGKGLPERVRSPGTYKVYGSGGIVGSHNKPLIEGPGIVVGRKGTVGSVYWETDDFFPIDTTLYVLPKINIKNRFAFYLLKSLPLQDMNTDAAVPGLNRDNALRLEVNIPTTDIQTNIVEFLSKYDDLISINNKRIELLQKSSIELYKEWFVQFRFPGHEHVKIIDGVPEGWTAGCVGDTAKIFSGYAFKSKDWLDEGNPVIKIKNITSNNTVDISDCQCVDDNVAEKANKFKLSAGDMLIAMTGATVGKVGLMPTSERAFYLNQRVGKFESKLGRGVTPLLLSFFNSDKAQSSILNLAGGAAQPNISAKQIESIELTIPPETLLNTFLDETENLFSLRLNLVDQNFILTQARDLLLPKLMNGEVAV